MNEIPADIIERAAKAAVGNLRIEGDRGGGFSVSELVAAALGAVLERIECPAPDCSEQFCETCGGSGVLWVARS